MTGLPCAGVLEIASSAELTLPPGSRITPSRKVQPAAKIWGTPAAALSLALASPVAKQRSGCAESSKGDQ